MTENEEEPKSGNGLKIILAFTLIAVLIAGVRIYFIHRERVADENAPVKQAPTYKLTDDDVVSLKKKFQSSLKDAKDLDGKPIWVSAGGQMEYYPVTAHRADYTHPAGILLGAERLDVKDMILQAAPKKTANRIPTGDKQVLMVFTKPDDPKKEYATPVGYVSGSDYTFYLDQIYFYDDPHILYKHWPPDIWTAVDRHEAKPGMNELQVMLALGQVSSSGSTDMGNRTVQYYNNGKPVRVVFEKNRATEVTPVAAGS